MLVCVVREVGLPEESISLDEKLAPEFDVDVFALVVRGQELLRHGDWLAIEVVPERNACEREERGHNVRVRRGDSLHGAFGHARSADEKGYVDIFFNVAAFARREPVLANVETVVCRVDEVRVVQHCRVRRQTLDDGVDELIHRLQRLESFAVPVIVVVNLSMVQLPERLEVRCSTCLKLR